MKILTPIEIQTLATYNAEEARGIVHTQEWIDQMAEFQALFDKREQLERATTRVWNETHLRGVAIACTPRISTIT